MTIANDIIFLSLRNAGVNGVGQTPKADDVNDSFKILNAWIEELNLERRVAVNTIVLPTFPDLTTDVPFWSPYEHVLLTSMAVRLRQIYALPPVDLDVQLATSALRAFQAQNLHQYPGPDADPSSPLSMVYMALRAAGRLSDAQGIDPGSQDVTEAHLQMLEMVDEWERERDVRVIPGDIPDLSNINAPITGTFVRGMRNAITLNLAVRLRDMWGIAENKSLNARADRALQLIQAVNQQQIAPLHGGIPETCQQAIFLALRMAGRITDQQRVADNSADVDAAFSLLVMMLAQWQRKRWLVWNEQEVAAVSTGAMWYGIGPGQMFNTSRPDKIHAAWVRLKPQGGFGGLPEELPFPLGASGGGRNPVDISLSIIEAREDYSRITIKDLKTIPSAVFYDSAFPVGRLYFWPVAPANDYSLHVVVKGSLPAYESIDDLMGLPPEYVDALVNNLACRILVASGQPVSPFLLGQARASLNTIRLANSQIATLSLPGILGGRGGGDVSTWAGAGLNQAWTVSGPAVLS